MFESVKEGEIAFPCDLELPTGKPFYARGKGEISSFSEPPSIREGVSRPLPM